MLPPSQLQQKFSRQRAGRRERGASDRDESQGREGTEERTTLYTEGQEKVVLKGKTQRLFVLFSLFSAALFVCQFFGRNVKAHSALHSGHLVCFIESDLKEVHLSDEEKLKKKKGSNLSPSVQ